MKRLNLYEIYDFGKQLAPLANIQADSKVGAYVFTLWMARNAIVQFCSDESVLLPTSQRAALNLMVAINAVIPTDANALANIEGEETFTWLRAESIKKGVANLETVLSNDMPGISAYLVLQKGIYSTDALVSHAENSFLPEIRDLIPEMAKNDIIQAGKCLAYEIPIACAFHMWRAMETVMDEYHLKLTNKNFEDLGINKTWYSYIQELEKAGADTKITKFLDHVREAYRNPQTHPREVIDITQAFGLFGAAVSSINQMILAIKALPAKPAKPVKAIASKPANP